MVHKKRRGSTADKYVDGTLDLIRERGGSHGVTLREVSNRLGYAHTNAYNYFTDLQDMLWAALRKALLIYAEAIVAGLHDRLSPYVYLRRLLSNYAEFGIEDPGLYRFISSDPLPQSQIPPDILMAVVDLKAFIADVIGTVVGDFVTPRESEEIASIVLAYVDGEALAVINDRLLPGEDVRGRAVRNAMRIVQLMTAKIHDGIDLKAATRPASYPVLDLQEMAKLMGQESADKHEQEGGVV